MLAIESAFPQFVDVDGTPINNGQLFFGVANLNPETNPITVYWDAAGTQAAAQPIQTINGYAVRNGTPASIFVNGDYSLNVRNGRGNLVFFAPTSKNPVIDGSVTRNVDAITAVDATGLTDGTVIIAKGRSAAGDGGGGVFRYVAGSAQAADGGTVFAPSVGSGRLFRDGWTVLGFKGHVNAIWFGAKGDNVADDTAAIQSAFNANSSNVSIYFPRGIYLISSTILIPQSRATKMYGDGFNPQETTNPLEGTVIKWAGVANGLMFSSNVSGGANTSGLVIKDMRFDGNNVASRGMVIGADAAHPQHEYFENVQFRNYASNGTDAALDLAGASYSKFGVADSNFINVLIDGGARALRVSSQQLNFYGGAIGAKNGSVLVELGDNAHPKFYGTGFYSGPGNPVTVFGVAGTVGIDGLECYGCWNEGQQRLFGRLGSTSPVVSAFRVIFNGQRSACVSSGTRVIDLTGLNCNLVWDGGYNDNIGLAAVYLETGSTMTVYQLQAGGFTYSGTGIVTEYRSNGIKNWLGNGLTDNVELDTNKSVTGRNSVSSKIKLVTMNSDDLVVLGDDTSAALTKVAAGPSANYPAGQAKYNGVIGADNTNAWLVFYANGVRFKVVGVAY